MTGLILGNCFNHYLKSTIHSLMCKSFNVGKITECTFNMAEKGVTYMNATMTRNHT